MQLAICDEEEEGEKEMKRKEMAIVKMVWWKSDEARLVSLYFVYVLTNGMRPGHDDSVRVVSRIFVVGNIVVYSDRPGF